MCINKAALVSIIIPSYNHAEFVRDAIDSVYAQDYPHIETLVIDDGSSDNSPQLLTELQKKYGFKLILKKNEGVCVTINKGIDLSKGEYIVFLASDDILTPGRIREQVELMNTNAEMDVISGAMNLISRENKFLKTIYPKKIGSMSFKNVVRGIQPLTPTCMIRRSVYERFGRYSEKYMFEDLYLWLKISSQGGKICAYNNIWANYRYEGLNDSRNERYYRGYVQIMTDYLPDPLVFYRLQRARLGYLFRKIMFSLKRM